MNPNQPIDPVLFEQLMTDLQVLLTDESVYELYQYEQANLLSGWLYGLEPHHQN